MYAVESEAAQVGRASRLSPSVLLPEERGSCRSVEIERLAREVKKISSGFVW